MANINNIKVKDWLRCLYHLGFVAHSTRKQNSHQMFFIYSVNKRSYSFNTHRKEVSREAIKDVSKIVGKTTQDIFFECKL